jgi:hypothetical protein
MKGGVCQMKHDLRLNIENRFMGSPAMPNSLTPLHRVFCPTIPPENSQFLDLPEKGEYCSLTNEETGLLW